MNRENVIDVFGWASIIAWLGFSAYFAWSENGDMFQRAGTLGIVAGVGYFAAVKWPATAPIGYHQSKTITQSQVISLAQGLAVANENTRILAAALAQMREREGKDVLEPIKALATLPAADMQKYDARQRDQDAKFDQLLAQAEDADRIADKVSRSGVRLQAIVVILGTLQSGFGSLLFNNSCNGVIPC